MKGISEGGPKEYNAHTVTEIGGDIYYKTTATDVSIMIMTLESTLAIKEATTYKNF